MILKNRLKQIGIAAGLAGLLIAGCDSNSQDPKPKAPKAQQQEEQPEIIGYHEENQQQSSGDSSQKEITAQDYLPRDEELRLVKKVWTLKSFSVYPPGTRNVSELFPETNGIFNFILFINKRNKSAENEDLNEMIRKHIESGRKPYSFEDPEKTPKKDFTYYKYRGYLSFTVNPVDSEEIIERYRNDPQVKEKDFPYPLVAGRYRFSDGKKYIINIEWCPTGSPDSIRRDIPPNWSPEGKPIFSNIQVLNDDILKDKNERVFATQEEFNIFRKSIEDYAKRRGFEQICPRK